MPAQPLNERVPRTTDAAHAPAAVDGVRWRALSVEDVDALVELHRSIAAADHPDWTDTREEIRDELGHRYVDLALDSLAAVADDGELLAWGLVILPPTQETLVRSILQGGVAPGHRGRGIGRALLAWQHARALQQLAGSSQTLPGWVVVSADERAPASGRTIERAGFTPQRWFHNLTRTVTDSIDSIGEIGEIEAATGIGIVTYAPRYSAGAHAARDAAFRGHGGSQPMDDEQWTSMTSMSTAAPRFSFVALDSAERVVGLLLALVDEDAWASQGFSSAYVWVLGVVPESRGRGVARRLLAAHLRSLSEAGIDRSVLDVATDGGGDGLSLYTSMGYLPRSTSVNYVRVY